jgi:hypothetical protein
LSGRPDNAAFSSRVVEALVIAHGFLVLSLVSFPMFTIIITSNNEDAQVGHLGVSGLKCKPVQFKIVKNPSANWLNTIPRASHVGLDSSTPAFFIEAAFPLHH